MKLGLVSSILPEYSFEEVIDFIAASGIDCVELACWPEGKAERRYAGISHLDVNDLTDEKVSYIQNYLKEKNVQISSLAYYPNPLDENPEKRLEASNHLLKLIDASAKLDINMVTTFIGRISHKSIEENLVLVKEIWIPILKRAESKGVKIAIENCPMLFTQDEWPGGKNLMTTPYLWKRVFEVLDSPNLGLNYDPSHFVWQQMDYIKPIYDFREKIFHVHFKDIKILHDHLNDFGIMAVPLKYMSPKLPGLGDVDWGKYVSALTDIDFKGFSCIEIEDKAFEKNHEDVLKSIHLSIRYLKNFVA